METTTLTIHLSKDASLALEKKARNTGKQVEDYVEGLLEVQAAGSSLDQINAKKPPPKQSIKVAASIVDKTFGSSGPIKKQELISLAEDEEFGGY